LNTAFLASSKIWLKLLVLSLLLFSQIPANAGTPAPFGRKITVKPQRVALQHTFLTENRGMQFNVKIGQKILPNISVNTDWALGKSIQPYFGFDLHGTVFLDDLIALGAYGGMHFGGYENGEDLGATLFFDPFESLGFFLAYDVDFNSRQETHLCFGVDFPLSKNMGFMFCYERGIKQTPYDGFSSGFIFFF